MRVGNSQAQAGVHGVLGDTLGDALFHQFKTFVELPAGDLVHAQIEQCKSVGFFLGRSQVGSIALAVLLKVVG